MAHEEGYARRVSSEEARAGYILILNSRLSFFPPVGSPFRMKHGSTARKVKVEAIPCTCRGPERPHEHYVIRWSGLKKGQAVTVRKDGSYVLSASG
jgi:hypothetical protein